MSILSTPPTEFQIYNDLQSKRLAIVVDIPGVDYLTTATIGRKLRYGDPFLYGDPSLLYGGLVPVGSKVGERGQKSLLSLDGSSLTISQRLEPEQGRASISTLSMTFIDKDKFMTQLITPGKIVDEILGREVKIWLGYLQNSFPEQFFIVWRGRIAQVNPEIGRISIQFTDPNLVKRQSIFFFGKSELTSPITSGATTVPVVANTDFTKKIQGPDGTWDGSVKCYLKISDEVIEYQQTGQEATGFGVNQFLNVSRGARGTVAVAHSAGDTVESLIELSGHAIDLALKLQLSGFNGNFLSNYSITGFHQTGDPVEPFVPNAIVLNENVDASRDLGLTVGDFITVSGDTVPANNGPCKVLGFQDSLDYPNRLIITDKTFSISTPSPATLAIRSQFDTLPTNCGAKMFPWEVDIGGHLSFKYVYLSSPSNSYKFLITSSESAKTFIESQIMLPLGAYCLTRQGKSSMGYTKPPIADERTTTLSEENIIDPQNIKVQRGLNNRKYFNEINWEFDYNDEGSARSLRKTLDTDSLNKIGISSVLPIKATGAKTSLGFTTIVERRERFLLNRYSKAAVLIDVKTNFGTGNLIEAGDVVVLNDNGQLQIPNMATGDRDMGTQLFEVINRSIDLKTGQVSLQLLGGIESLVDDRYATISPSSLVTTGTTASQIRITESFGAIFPAQEWKKWVDYFGLKIWVHSPDYTTRSEETTLTGLDPSDSHTLLVSPPLSFVPQVGDIVDLAFYPTNNDPTDQQLAKQVHAFLDPTVPVVSGVSVTSFNIGLGDASKFNPGAKLLIHNADYTILSPEVEIQSVAGTLVTVATTLGFVPAAGQFVELLGFLDLGGPYRFI